jgi:hypothetical protein
MRNAYKMLIGKPEGMRPPGRSMRKYKDNIRLDFREIGWGGVDWIHIVWLRIGTSGGLL